MDKKQEQLISKLYHSYESELLESVVPFWEKYSIDKTYGGYYTCLTRDGSIYSTDKYMWLQSRAVWMFAKLYNDFEQKSKWLKYAEGGLKFIQKYGRNKEGRVYFSLNRQGEPIHIQRKIYSEIFFVLALAEMSKATGNDKYLKEAETLFEMVYKLWKNPEKLGRPILKGIPPSSALAEPMVFLCMVEELEDVGTHSDYSSILKEMMGVIKKHIFESEKIVLENVGIDGKKIDAPIGRVLNPGHSIELAWFLIHYAMKRKDMEAIETALKIIDWSLEKGWDKKFGGLFYFLDEKGLPPLQLEWDMKLWWPICEALYATLLAYRVCDDEKYLKWHLKIKEYGFSKFSDRKYGEWFGYLNRRGEVTHELKGGAWKGFFHIPRALLYCMKLLGCKSCNCGCH